MLVISRRVRIPLREFHFHFARSTGSGGQNVNKVNTKASLRWAVARSPSLPDDVRRRFAERFRRRITRDGDVIVTSQRFREQGRNVADCLEKLRAMLREVAVAPKRRTPTKASAGARERRLREKRERSTKKQRRGRVRDDE